MNFRIVRTPKGYIVEQLQIKWSILGLKKKWIPFIKTSGIDEAWNHKTFDYAMINLLDGIKQQVLEDYINLKQ